MSRRNPGRWPGLTALLAAAVATLPAGARADGGVTVGPWAGVLVLDPHLADYRWETDARPVWGVSGMASAGRLAGGARVWRASTRQATGIPGDARTFAVSLTGVEGTGEVTIVRVLGARLGAVANAGVVRFDWSPREMTIEDAGLGAPVVVEADPIPELTGGGGLVARRALPFGLEAAVALERSWFALETSHRRGAEIVTERETFGSWTGRVEIARRLFGL